MKIKDIVSEGWYDSITGLRSRAKASAVSRQITPAQVLQIWKQTNNRESTKQELIKLGASPADAEKLVSDAEKSINLQVQQSSELNTPPEGTILLVVAPNSIEYFKSYTGKWYAKNDNTPNVYDVTHPVTRREDAQALDNLLASGKNIRRIPVKQDPTITSRFVFDKKRKNQK